ncbi:siderophore-interacting protein [Paeniglutamicibacter sp. R2-26]|uniref:siderophore-interacting protein n=1 Tax=Paeniglutamicibacter sp. R2-26 TaxID=3144417 RepID=UPI003EE6BC3E
MQFCEPARVTRAEYLTPHMIRIRLEILGDWRWPTHGIGDDKIDLAFPRAGETETDVDYFNRDDYGTGTATDEPPWRHYTVRRVHDRGAAIDIDFVVHKGGVASEWAVRAEPGHVLGVFATAEPRAYYAPPANQRRLLLVADATGLPGLGRIIEGLEPGTIAHAIVEVPTDDDRQVFDSAAELTIDWLVGTGLGRSISALPEAVEAWAAPPELDYAWVACEAAASRRIRRHLRAGVGLGRRSHIAVGYWTDGHIGHFEQDEHQHSHQHEEAH